MYDKAIEVLNIFCEHGYLAYIVGGYPRDMLLGIKTNDIDICTNAKPKDIIKIFDCENSSDNNYGSSKVMYKNCVFDVTTFRKDIKYVDNRKPIKIKYINDLEKDLHRRDFTINTICIDKDENLIDLLSGRVDISNKIIRTVGNPKYKIKEDCLRILRAIRFASVLDFDIDDKTYFYIKKYGYLLTKLSYFRKKEELNKIFSCKNKEKARSLLIETDIYKYLEIYNIGDIVLCDDIMGIWSQLEVSPKYEFSKLERGLIKNIREMLKSNIDEYSIYKYGLYVSSVVASIKGFSIKEINSIYSKLPIYYKKDLKINYQDVASILNKKPGRYLKDILNDIEKLVVTRKLENDKEVILNYIKNNY